VTAADWRNEKRNEKGTKTNRDRIGQGPNRGDKDRGDKDRGDKDRGDKGRGDKAPYSRRSRLLGYVPAIFGLCPCDLFLGYVPAISFPA
jgi:hypothetical protein